MDWVEIFIVFWGAFALTVGLAIVAKNSGLFDGSYEPPKRVDKSCHNSNLRKSIAYHFYIIRQARNHSLRGYYHKELDDLLDIAYEKGAINARQRMRLGTYAWTLISEQYLPK